MQKINKILIIICIIFTAVTCLIVATNPVLEDIYIDDIKVYQLYINDSTDIKIAPNPSNSKITNVIWETSDSTIATVADGTVYARNIGECTITLKANGITKTCNISVIPRPVSKIDLTAQNKNILIGETLKINTNIYPYDATDKNLQWSSSDIDIATVDQDGTVLGKSAGSVTIYGKSSNNVSASITINVKEKIFPETISINRTSLELIKNKTFSLICSLSPSNTSVKNITWISSNNEVATVSNSGVVTAKNAGVAKITGTTENGLTVSCTVQVSEITATGLFINNQTSLVGLNVGDKVQLSCKLLPTNTTDSLENLVWESKDTQVVTVDQNGKLTAVGTGSTYIIVKLGNLSGACMVLVVE